MAGATIEQAIHFSITLGRAWRGKRAGIAAVGDVVPSPELVCSRASREGSASMRPMYGTPSLGDRRRAQRSRVTLPVELRGGRAVTRALRACGVCFATPLTLGLGECLRLPLVLAPVDPGRRLRLQCRGRGGRIEPCGIGVGVAVDIIAYRRD
jgi:hypothetical protein